MRTEAASGAQGDVGAKLGKKDRSHATILASAARLLRERGIVGASVADVMKGAGLTVGGFYAHFGSKQELIDQSLRRAAGELRDLLFDKIEAKPADSRAEVILKRYLSPEHRDATTIRCPFPAVVGEIGTQAPEHAPVLAEQVAALSERLQELLPKSRGSARSSLALGLVALMYGGLSLARAAKGTQLSDDILRACRTLGIAAARGMSKG